MPQILEARVTSPKREELSGTPHGIGLVVFNLVYDVLLGWETETDQYRGEKRRNIFTETWDPALDVRFKLPLARTVKEELGVPMDRFRVTPGTYRETNGLYVSRLGYDYKYRCVCLQYLGDHTVPAHTVFHAKNGEIIDHRWFPLDALPETLEYGACLVITAYREILKI